MMFRACDCSGIVWILFDSCIVILFFINLLKTKIIIYKTSRQQKLNKM